jgi:hypothetical protein
MRVSTQTQSTGNRAFTPFYIRSYTRIVFIGKGISPHPAH